MQLRVSFSDSKITVEPLTVQYDDGFTDAPVTVEFKDDPVVRGVSEEDVDDNEAQVINATITFRSEKPISFTKNLTFTDIYENRCAHGDQK